MQNIFLTVDVIGYPTGYIIIEVVDARSPSVTVQFQHFLRPSVNPGNVEFTGLPEATYIINIYNNTTPTVGGTLIRTFTIDKSLSNQTDRADLYLIGGVTNGMTVGQGTFLDPDGLLTGWNYSLERRGVGTLEIDADYTQLTAGFSLSDPADQFGDGDLFIAHFRAMITLAQPQPVNAGALFTPDTLITADITLDNTYVGQWLTVQGSGNTVVITLPNGADMPIDKMIPFLSDGGSHITATLLCAGSDQFSYMNGLRSALYMGQGEILWIYWDGTNWRVGNADGNFKTVGEIISSYSLTALNTIQCAGQLLNRLEYARLWEWINTMIDPSLLVSEAVWNFQNVTSLNYESHGLFSVGDGSTTFRLPVLYGEFAVSGKVNGGTGFMRGVDGATRKAGSMERDGVGDFKADIQGQIVQKNGNGRQFLTLDFISDGFIGTGSVLDVPFTGKDAITDIATHQTKPANTGTYLSIRY